MNNDWHFDVVGIPSLNNLHSLTWSSGRYGRTVGDAQYQPAYPHPSVPSRVPVHPVRRIHRPNPPSSTVSLHSNSWMPNRSCLICAGNNNDVLRTVDPFDCTGHSEFHEALAIKVLSGGTTCSRVDPPFLPRIFRCLVNRGDLIHHQQAVVQVIGLGKWPRAPGLGMRPWKPVPMARTGRAITSTC